jgi:hypothetical protein
LRSGGEGGLCHELLSENMGTEKENPRGHPEGHRAGAGGGREAGLRLFF